MVEVLSALDFQNLRREKRLEYALYFEEADDLASTFQRAQRNLADPIWLSEKDEGQKLLAASAGARYAVDFLTLSYSAGCDLAKLRALYPSIVEAWRTHERFHHAYDQCPKGASSQAATYALLGDAFHIVNRMVCLGILLGWGELLPSVARIIEYKNPRMDGMLEHMLSHYVPDRDTTITGCTRHRPYFGTLKIFSSPVNARPAMMAEYLEDCPRCQNSCRPVRSEKMGAITGVRSGTVRTGIQRQSGGAVATAGKCIDQGCGLVGGRERIDFGALAQRGVGQSSATPRMDARRAV